MKPVLLALAVAVGLVASAAVAEESAGLRLDESVLGVPDFPFRVDDVLTDEQLTTLRCTESGNGVLVCPVRRYEDRTFAVMIERSASENRVTTALVFWTCAGEECTRAFEQTVASYAQKLGRMPERLDETPIWKDREAARRDLMVTRMGDNMISVMLVRSDP